MVKCLSTMWETWLRSLGREDPLEKEMAINSLSSGKFFFFFFFFLQQVVSWRSSSESVSLKCTQSSIWIMSRATSGGSLELIL